MAYLNHNIPTQRCFIRNEYLYNHESGEGDFTSCDVHSVTSMEGITPLFEAFLENGVNWTRRPINAFCWKRDAPKRYLEDHVYWDCFSSYADVSIRNRLSGLRAQLITPSGDKVEGEYLFTLDWGFENKGGMLNVSFSETFEHKCAHMFKMDEGNYFAYPNNRIVWYDKAWTFNRLKENPGYKIDQNIYSVEGKQKYETDNLYFTNFTLLNESLQDISTKQILLSSSSRRRSKNIR
jgi:hypothetical protein